MVKILLLVQIKKFQLEELSTDKKMSINYVIEEDKPISMEKYEFEHRDLAN